MTTDEFIVLCDGISCESKLQVKPTYEEEKVRIHDRLADTSLERMPYRDVLNLRTGFIYLSEIDDSRDYSSYFYILEKITEHFNASVKEVAAWSNVVWYDVIQFVKSLPEYPRTNAFKLEEFRKKERERARAAIRLRSFGATLTVKDNDLKISNYEGVIDHINTLVGKIGGVKGCGCYLKNFHLRLLLAGTCFPIRATCP